MTDRVKRPTLEEMDRHAEEVKTVLRLKTLTTFRAALSSVSEPALQALLTHYPEGAGKQVRRQAVLDELKARA